MAKRVWIIWVNTLLVFWIFIYSFFVTYFDDSRIYSQKLKRANAQLHSRTRELAHMNWRMMELKESVVKAGVKIKSDTGWDSQERNIASVLAGPAFKDIPQIRPGRDLFENGKEKFQKGDYLAAQNLFAEMIQTHPESSYLPETGFLLAESYFHTKNTEKTLKAIDFVVSHFPETQSSGLALCRLGKIFEKQERFEDATEVFHLVTEFYPQSHASRLAEESLKDLKVWQ